MKVPGLIALAALAAPFTSAAQAPMRALVPCDEIELELESVAVGADRSGVRTYYRGAVTLFVVDRVEPACCSFGVAIVMPPPPGDEPAGMSCWTKWGYAGVDLRRAQTSYDGTRGLTLHIPTLEYEPETGGSTPGAPIRLRIDASRGTIVDLDARQAR